MFTVELTKQLIAKRYHRTGCRLHLRRFGKLRPDVPGGCRTGRAEFESRMPAARHSAGAEFRPCLVGRLDLLAGEIAELLGVDLPQLPLVLSAPQWLEEQALADGCFGLALGFTVHLGLPPFVTGSPVILDVLANQLPDLTGGKLIVDTDVSSSADALEQVILEKRKAPWHLNGKEQLMSKFQHLDCCVPVEARQSRYCQKQ